MQELPLADRYAVLTFDTDHPDKVAMGVHRNVAVRFADMQGAVDWALTLPEGVTLIVDMGQHGEAIMTFLWQARRARGQSQTTTKVRTMTMGQTMRDHPRDPRYIRG